jgi:putative membrane protein (TIGR04086 family)
MNASIKYVISICITFLLLLLFSFILAILVYFEVLTNNSYKILLLLFLVISVFSGSYYLGFNSLDKGYLNGLICGIIICVLFSAFSLIFKSSLNFSSIIYYFVIIITSLIGGTIGINKKTTK